MDWLRNSSGGSPFSLTRLLEPSAVPIVLVLPAHVGLYDWVRPSGVYGIGMSSISSRCAMFWRWEMDHATIYLLPKSQVGAKYVLADAYTPSSLLSKSSTMPYLRYFIM